MPFGRTRSRLVLGPEARAQLVALSKARMAPLSQVERAQMMLAYADGEGISAIARRLHTNRPRVERCLDKALQLGPLAALKDLPRSGRPATITPEARAWVTALACRKPKELGYSYELWTLQLLADHVQRHCEAAGHPSLRQVVRGTIAKLLTEGEVQPHRIRYYLERRDPDFELKMAQVLCVYHEVALLRRQEDPDASLTAYLSYDEKPGIQAIENLAPDLPAVPGQHPQLARDHQYRRHGTVSLLAGIDLLTGEVHGMVADRHRSREFVAFLKLLDTGYPPEIKLRIILDNHSAHTSKETRAYLSTRPNRFEFIFTPTHGSWLNLIEAFFAKMAKTMLRGIRVSSKAELRARLDQYLREINEAPVVFRWKYGIEPVSSLQHT
jgi:transposase